MKKFFEEFKKFITRGNVVDMAVGVTVGSAFTAIVNGLSNFILKPLINWILALVLGADALSDIYTILKPAIATDESTTAVEYKGQMIELSQSIYIDWGSFINAVINFFIIAFVLFSIVKIVNNLREESKKMQNKLTRADKKELKARGISILDIEAVTAYIKAKEAEENARKAKAEEAAREAAKAAEEAAKANSTESLLKEIRDLLAKRDAQN